MDHLNPQMSQNCVQYGKVPPLLLCRSVCGANPHPSAVHCSKGQSMKDVSKMFIIFDPPLCLHGAARLQNQAIFNPLISNFIYGRSQME